MSMEIYFAYCLATALLVLMPGPIVTLIVANTLTHGTRTGLATSIGSTTGTGVLLAVGGFGMVWVLAFLSDWLIWIRWAGAASLFYLGVRQWRAPVHGLDETDADQGPPKAVFLHGFIVAVTNPKTILFYAAFFPQFIDPAGSVATQLTIMSFTFLVIALILDSAYALMAGRLRPWLTGTHRGRLRNRITGSLLMVTGAGLALVRKS
ncbi:MAG: LysE family translocator [Rhodospirillaceae bacterium]|nr:LysE family translocator [Rhodospirillaceae bacterium]